MNFKFAQKMYSTNIDTGILVLADIFYEADLANYY